MWAKVVQWFDDLWGRLRGRPDDEGRSELEKAARAKAKEAWDQIEKADEMEPEATQDKDLDKLDHKRNGIAFDYEPVIEGRTWQVEVEAKEGRERATRRAGDGWVALDEQRKEHLAPDDHSQYNRRHLRPHSAHTVLGQPDLRPPDHTVHSPYDGCLDQEGGERNHRG